MADAKPVALVTGGTRGIGRAIVELLLENGWNVGFCGRQQAAVDAAVADLKPRYGENVGARLVDVRRYEEVEAFVRWAQDGHGRIDCLVNNAGLGHFAPVDKLSLEQWHEVLDTNLSGVFYGIRAVAPFMRRQGRGWIFNVGSLAGKNAFPNGAAYNASKFGLIGLSEAAMQDLRPDGIRMAAILPGSVNTEFGHPGRAQENDWMLAPEDVARIVLDFLAFPDRALPSLIELRPSRPPKKG